jgi:hypothetical protein
MDKVAPALRKYRPTKQRVGSACVGFGVVLGGALVGIKEKGSERCLLIFTLDEVASSGGLGAGVVLVAEFLDAASSVDDLLCAGVERVALGTDFNVQRWFAHRGAGCKLVAAAACHCDLFVFRVDGGSHFVFLAKVGRGICTRTDTN